MRPYSPGGALNALAAARNPWKNPTPSAQRLRRGLPGYLILFAPHAFAPQRQVGPENRLRHRCSSRYLRISPLHREFQSPLPTSSLPVSTAGPGLSPEISQRTQQTVYELFTPNNSGQRLRPTCYRGCWHVVSRRFFCRYRHFRFVPAERGLQPEGLHPPRGVAASGFRPLRNIPHCCPP